MHSHNFEHEIYGPVNKSHIAYFPSITTLVRNWWATGCKRLTIKPYDAIDIGENQQRVAFATNQHLRWVWVGWIDRKGHQGSRQLEPFYYYLPWEHRFLNKTTFSILNNNNNFYWSHTVAVDIPPCNMDQSVEDIPHCHHHHHHLQYHSHHHHHGPLQDVPRSMGQQNKSHYKFVHI